MRLYIDKGAETIHYVLSNDSTTTRFVEMYKFKERVSTLQRNKFKHHSGHLRNENWPLDSLYKQNTYWEQEKQMRYVDSMGLSRHK